MSAEHPPASATATSEMSPATATATATATASSAQELKEQGNALVGQGDFEGAAARYSSALELLGDSDDQDLRIALLSNRALCHLKLDKPRAEEAVRDCSAVLELQPGHEKALFRRAQGFLALNKLLDATKDAKLAQHINPKNKAVVKMLQDINVLARGGKPASDANSSPGSAGPQSHEYPTLALLAKVIDTSETPGESHHDREMHMRHIFTLLSDEDHCDVESNARHLAASPQAIKTLWDLVDTYPVALSILARLAQRPHRAAIVRGAFELPSKASCQTNDEGAEPDHPAQPQPSASLPRRLADIACATPPTFLEQHAVAAVLLLLRLTQPDSEPSAPASTTSADEPANKKKREPLPPPPTNKDTTEAFVRALQSPHAGTREVAVEGCALYCGQSSVHAEQFLELGGLEALLQVAGERPQLASIILGRILPAMNPKSTKDKDELLQKHSLQLVKPALAEDCEPKRHHDGLSALSALLSANLDLGVWVAEQPGILEAVLRIMRTSADLTTAMGAEVLAQLAGTEKGRGLVGGNELCMEALHRLSTAENEQIRASCAVALTKLNAINFEANSEKGTLVLTSLAGLLQKDASDQELYRGVEAVCFVITDTDVKDMLVTEDGFKVLQRLCQVSRSLKPEASAGSSAAGDRNKSSKAPSAQSEAALPYGLAYVFQNLTMDEDDKRREKLREMEVSQEQWEQFEELTKSKTRKGRRDTPQGVAARIDAFVRADGVPALRALITHYSTSTRVMSAAAYALMNCATQQRVRGTMIAQGAVGALLRILNTINSHASQRIHPSDKSTQGTGTKGKKATSGASGSAVVAPATLAEEKEARRFATHALAKLLITTDPRLVSDSHLMDSMAPLVQQIRDNVEEELQAFECLMALTNLASISYEFKERCVALHAINVIEYAQFSDNLMVRQAATECMLNLAPTEAVIEWLSSPEKLKLWIMFADAYDESEGTSSAATGMLATIAADARVARALRDPSLNAVVRLCALARECPLLGIVHRVTVALSSLEMGFDDETTPGGSTIGDEREVTLVRDAMETVVERWAADPQAVPAVQTAKSCLEFLRVNKPSPTIAAVPSDAREGAAEETKEDSDTDVRAAATEEQGSRAGPANETDAGADNAKAELEAPPAED